ncbi:MAG: PRC-barrel domain-containing protein [Marivibrio sp.]|uniref:PRC-barrel domain containing protein n=1 Tax=Marivibrio sp. TaxID=2039719 RepID=UPI0032EE9050
MIRTADRKQTAPAQLVAGFAAGLAALGLVAGAAGAADSTATSTVVDLEGWDATAVQDDWRGAVMLGNDVFTPDGAEVGDIEEIQVDRDGFVSGAIVETDGAIADYPKYFFADLGDIRFNDVDETATLTMSLADVRAIEKVDRPERVDVEMHYKVSDLLDMQVATESDGHYGEVVDVLFDGPAGALSAFVIESDGRAGRRFALPNEADWVLYDERRIQAPYSADELGRVETYEPAAS